MGDQAAHPLRNAVSGVLSAVISKSAVAPLDRVKILLQVQREPADLTWAPLHRYHRGVVDCLRRVSTEQGVLSFWRGNLTALLSYFPHQILNFGFNEKYKKVFQEGVDRSAQSWRYFAGSLVCGGAAGASSLCFVYPLEFSRTRLAADIGKTATEHEFKNLRRCLYKITKSDGIAGLFRGFGVSVQGIIVYRAAYFGLHDAAKSKLTDSNDANITVSWLVALSVTLVAGLISYPFDTVRCRMVMQAGRKRGDITYSGTLDCWRKMVRNEGVEGFYRGLGCVLLKGVGGAVMLVLYDEIKKMS